MKPFTRWVTSNETFAFLLLSSKWGVQVYSTQSSFDDMRGEQTSLVWISHRQWPHLQMRPQEPLYLCSIQETWSEIYLNPKYIVFKMGTLPPSHKTSINQDITKGSLDVRKLGVCPPLPGHRLHEDVSPVHSHQHTWHSASRSADSPTSVEKASDG